LLVCARRPFALFVFSNVPICGILTRCSITPFRPRISALASRSPSSSPVVVRRVCLKVSMLSRETRTAGVLGLLRAYIEPYQVPGFVTVSVSVSVGGVLPVCPLRRSAFTVFLMVHGPRAWPPCGPSAVPGPQVWPPQQHAPARNVRRAFGPQRFPARCGPAFINATSSKNVAIAEPLKAVACALAGHARC
jgi:hypothetical protein